MLAVQGVHHRFPADTQYGAIGYSGCRAHPKRLAGQGTFTKKYALGEKSDGGLPAGFRNYGEFDPALLNIKDRVRWIALGKDNLFFPERKDLPAFADAGKECVRIKANQLLSDSGRTHGLRFYRKSPIVALN